jgi:hypothetical protein
MAKHICIRIYPNDRVKITSEKGTAIEPAERDVRLKKGKKIGQACWWNENPTCIWYNGKKY